jgi:clan AA aspartic protease (TIGR02281 family)
LNKFVIITGISLITGLVLGWWVRGLYETPARVGSVDPGVRTNIVVPSVATAESSSDAVVEPGDLLLRLSNESTAVRVAAMRAHIVQFGDSYEVLVSLSRELTRQGEYEEALDLLLRSGFAVNSIVQQDELEIEIARFVDHYARELISLNQFGAVDQLYETLTLSMPHLGQYFLELADLRVRMGNPQSALLPLAQISNHTQLGAEARRLITQIEESESPAPKAMEELALIATAGQFLVEATIDDTLSITMLIDTGAAMTVLDSKVLEKLGYNLSGRQEYFATANGVVQAAVVTVGSLSLGKASLGNVSVGSLDLNMPNNVGGLLGMNFLRHYDFHIDQNRDLLILDQR